MYHNTNNLSGDELKYREQRAETQEDRVLAFFCEYPTLLFSPEEIHDFVFDAKCPITSVRRALTRLTERFKLTKTNTMYTSQWGAQTHTWCLSAGGPL
jgi:hypothetical protein